MAKVKSNIITQGLSGMLGDQLVFRQVNGRTIVSVAPGEQSEPATAAQTAQRLRFQEAIVYARGQAQDPQVQAEYEPTARERQQSVFNVLVADHMKAPNIEQVDLSGYSGQVGQIIRVVATDDFAVKAVRVRIENADGSLVEQGAAQQQANPNQWHYTTTTSNASLSGDKITVTATDNPGHSDLEERRL